MSLIDKQHLGTIFAMVFLTFVVALVLAKRRFDAGRSGLFPKGYFKLKQTPLGFELPRKPEQASRNLINLFEMPVLFYPLVFMLIWTQKTDTTSLTLCWIFVAGRYAHSFFHVGSNKLAYRFGSYLVSCSALLFAWGRLGWQLFL